MFFDSDLVSFSCYSALEHRLCQTGWSILFFNRWTPSHWVFSSSVTASDCTSVQRRVGPATHGITDQRAIPSTLGERLRVIYENLSALDLQQEGKSIWTSLQRSVAPCLCNKYLRGKRFVWAEGALHHPVGCGPSKQSRLHPAGSLLGFHLFFYRLSNIYRQHKDTWASNMTARRVERVKGSTFFYFVLPVKNFNTPCEVYYKVID